MKISFSTLPGNLSLNVGYGVAGFNMVTALQRLGHQVPFQDPSAPVQIHFSQPTWYEFDYPEQYKIGYTPWESTDLQEGWLDNFNMVDEVWTPSPLVAKWFKEAGVKPPVSVYEHGIDHAWTPQRYRRGEVLRFLHHGEPAGRKGGQMALEAFREAFGDQDDVQFVIKSHGASTIRAFEGRSGAGRSFYGDGQPHHMYKNVRLITAPLETEELISFYHSNHVLVYPSWGEGFGLIPLQGLACGMPTICTAGWAPYARFLQPSLALDSRLVDSPWQIEHPGKMFEPSFTGLVKAYQDAYENYDKLAGKSFKTAFGVHEAYDWDALTEKAFAKIVERFGP